MKSLLPLVLVLCCSNVLGINKCEIAGQPPVYQDAPCPRDSKATRIETETERQVEAQRTAKEKEKQRAEAAYLEASRPPPARFDLQAAVASEQAARKLWADAKAKIVLGMSESDLYALHPRFATARSEKIETRYGVTTWLHYDNDKLTLKVHNGAVEYISGR
jgi:regulator of protease activity HflC (stomatin/prohibitin superfamily)